MQKPSQGWQQLGKVTRQRGEATYVSNQPPVRPPRNLHPKSQPLSPQHQMFCQHWVVFFMGTWTSRPSPTIPVQASHSSEPKSSARYERWRKGAIWREAFWSQLWQTRAAFTVTGTLLQSCPGGSQTTTGC